MQQEMMVMAVMCTGTLTRAKLQSHHHQNTMQQSTVLAGRMPFLPPNQQCHKAPKAKLNHERTYQYC